MKIDNKKIDLFYDLLDEACMIYYNDTKKNYLESFVLFADALVNGLNDSKLSTESVSKLNRIIKTLEEENFLNEEVRLASELVLIKGYKSINMNLDFLTPDAINYIFSYICNVIIKKYYSALAEITIMDTCLGAGNLLQTIINNAIIKVNGIGIEKDELLAKVGKSLSLLIDNDVIINNNDALNSNNSLSEIVIGDFGETDEVYNIILKRLENIKDNGYFVYLINNDFFGKSSEDFKKILTNKCTLLGLIVLPSKFLSKNHIGKSIIIGKKELLKDYKMSIVSIDNDLTENNMDIVMQKINKMFE